MRKDIAKVMKTPEEIKKGLECLRNDNFPGEDCKRCPYLRHPVENTYICNFPERLNDTWDYIKQLEAQARKWISVEERLPDIDTEVLIYTNESLYNAAQYSGGERFWTLERNPDCWVTALGVTHWMPLPEPPKGGE